MIVVVQASPRDDDATADAIDVGSVTTASGLVKGCAVEDVRQNVVPVGNWSMHDDVSLWVRERSPVVDFENKSRRRTLVFERVAGAAQRQIVYGVLWRVE